jgi:hypothetical protein
MLMKLYLMLQSKTLRMFYVRSKLMLELLVMNIKTNNLRVEIIVKKRAYNFFLIRDNIVFQAVD